MKTGWSEKIRGIATANYVDPKRLTGETEFLIRVSDVLQDLRKTDFPPGNTPQVCSALRSEKFLKRNNVHLERIEGPKSLTSTTVVFHYRFKEGQSKPLPVGAARPASHTESGAPKAGLDAMYGFLKEVFAELGGGEKFLRDLRSGDREV